MTARLLRRTGDLVAVIVLAGAAAALALGSVDVVPLRAVFALQLILVLPGYALTALALGKQVRGAARVALVVGVSLAATALLGVVLNLLPSGLTTDAWAVALAGVTIIAALAALRRRLLERERWRAATWRAVWPGGRPAALFALAAVAVAAAIVIGDTGALHQQREEKFTQLWILPGTSGHTVQVGVKNGTPAPRTYRLVLAATPGSGASLLGPRVLQAWPRISLPPGEQWQATLRVPDALGRQRLQGQLYRAGSASVFRHVDLAATNR